MWSLNDNAALNVVADAMMILFLTMLAFDCFREREWNKRSAAIMYGVWLVMIMAYLTVDVAVEIMDAMEVNGVTEKIIGTVWIVMSGAMNIPLFLWCIEYIKEHTDVPQSLLALLISLMIASIGGAAYQFMAGGFNINGYKLNLNILLASMIMGLTILASFLAVFIGYRKFFDQTKFGLIILFVVVPGIVSLQPYWRRMPANIAMTLIALASYMDVWKQQKEELVAARLATMRSQIQPHFIYNSLTAIASLCDIDPAQAKQMTLDFSEYLETNLKAARENKPIPFVKELRHIDAYLRIEKTRFGDFLKVDYILRATEFDIPPLTVQPLVENAVKHGICPSENGGTVTIATMEYADGWKITVYDDGVGFDENERTHEGIGIENVRQRIAMQCNGVLEIRSYKGMGTTATIFIPKGGRK